MTNEDKKIASLYKEANKDEPPAHLDDSILSASRKAVEHTACASSPFSGGWPVPAAMAAVIVVHHYRTRDYAGIKTGAACSS